MYTRIYISVLVDDDGQLLARARELRRDDRARQVEEGGVLRQDAP